MKPRRNPFEMATHDYEVKRKKRDRQEAFFDGSYHNDKPLYLAVLTLIGLAIIVTLAIVINS